MKRYLFLLPALCLVLVLCACASTNPEPAETPVPTEAPAVEATAAPPPTATPAPTAAPTPAPTPTPEPRWVRTEETVSYTILTGGTPGAEALTIWLLGEGRELLESFGAEKAGESVFTADFGTERSQETIPVARDDTRRITLAADERLLNGGLLAELLPAFQYQYGYRVEVITGTGEDLRALSREADIAILSAGDVGAAWNQGAFLTRWPFASSAYVLE